MRVRPVSSLCVATALLCCFASFAKAQVPVTSGLEVWLDAADASTFTFSGSAITQWADKTGNGHHATPTIATGEPTRNLTALSGMPAVRFDGVNDGLAIAGAAGSFTRPYTAFVVDQYYGGVQGRTLQGRDGNNWLMGKWGQRDAHYANGFVYAPAPGVNSTAIGEATGNPTSSNYFVNGTAVGTAGNPVGNPGRLGLVGGGQYNEQSQADVSEVLWYNRVLTPIERQQVGAYLQNKWGLAGMYNANVLSAISQGAFSGGDAGEGLDFDGHFQYAVNVLGAGVGAIRDANFTNDTAAGVTVSAQNSAANWWSGPEFGATANDNNLETIMRDIRWSANPNTVDVALANIDPGQDYRLQLLFGEACCSRGFDVSVEGLLVADEFSPQAIQGGINNTSMGAQLTVDFFAPDSTLNFQLSGLQANFGDRNPIIQGFTLEFFPDAVATTSTPDGGTIDFSADLVIGPRTDVQTLTITNTGEANSELVLNDAFLTGAPEFSLLNFTPGTILAPGEMIDLLVEFDGNNALPGDIFTGQLELDTSSNATFGSLDGDNLFFQLNALVTPEPASLALWSLLGIAAAGYWISRRKKAA